jgi:hypothetical protein
MITSEVVYSDKNASVVFKDSINLVNVHASHGYYEMTVCGAKYSEVRGWHPFYIPIPEKDSILFVTGRNYDNGQAIVHVVNLKTKTEVHFPAYDSDIGSNIRNDGGSYERVKEISGDKLVICAGSASRTNCESQFFIDLKKPEFEKEEVIVWGAADGQTNRYIHLGGKRSQN